MTRQSTGLDYCSFALLDAHYLREERLFRELYKAAVEGTVAVFSMDKDVYRSVCPLRKALRSWAILGFYGVLLVLGVASLVVVAVR